MRTAAPFDGVRGEGLNCSSILQLGNFGEAQWVIM